MAKIRTKFILFFLISIFLLCLSSFNAIFYIEKLSQSTQKAASLEKASDDIMIYSGEFNNIISLYASSQPDKLEALRSEFNFSASGFNNAIGILKANGKFKEEIRRIENIEKSYKAISDKIMENKDSQIKIESDFNAILENLKSRRHEMADEIALESTDLKFDIANIGYKEKEFNFQYQDKSHSDEWLAAISSAKRSLADGNSAKLLELMDDYSLSAEQDILKKNELIDLELNNQYYIAKLDNIFIENRIINSAILKEIRIEESDIRKANGNYKLLSFIFIFSLLAFGSVLLVLSSRKITQSIIDLTNVSKKILEGNFLERANIRSNDEIEDLANIFNKMLDYINKNNEELREESAQMKALVSSMGEGLLVVNRKSNIIIANGKASNILRIPYKYLIGKDLRKIIKILINIEELPPGKWPVDEVIKSGSVFTVKPSDGYYLKTETGKTIPVEMTIAPLSGKEINRIVILFKDITEARLIEEEREFSRQNLESVLKSIYIERDNVQEEKTKLEALLNSIGDAVLATDENKQVIAFNPIAQKITGLNFNELEGEYFDKYINFVDEETKKVKNDFVDKVLKNGERLELNNLALINKKGHLILIDIDASPIKNNRGDIIGCIIVFKDVTEKREADRMRTDFISIVSHQLRTPLSAMKWFLEILMDGDVGTLKPKQKDIINDIYDSNKGMIEFVNQMLNVSRIESKRLAVNPEKLNLNKIAQELLKESSMFLEEKQQKLNYRYLAEEGLEINVDRSLLRNLLSGLVLNASRYTQRNGNVDVEITRYDKNYVLFKIKDDGIGIPESENEKIFKKFSRASNAIRFEANGTGLGLYIVKSIVNMVCGKIWFESEENNGSTFYFTLPIENMICEIEESRGTKSLI